MYRILVLFGILSISLYAQESVSLERINNSPEQFTDKLISVQGFCERWLKDGSGDVNYFVLKDNYGFTVKVRTLQESPPPGQVLLLNCFVVLDAQKGSFYLDERVRKNKGLGERKTNIALLIGIGVGGVIFIVLAILILLQLRKEPGTSKFNHQTTSPDATIKVQSTSTRTPLDTTHKMLPGKFIVEKEGKKIKEIKLYQVNDKPVFTIGRKSGPAMHHIQIDDPTVSNEQALLQYENKRFWLTNKSSTNPTRINDDELRKDESRELMDGSIVVMGEITLTLKK